MDDRDQPIAPPTTKREIEQALLPIGLPPAESKEWPGEREGAANAYVCDTDGRHITITVLADWGTTPFMIGCPVDGCPGTARSCMYRLPDWLGPSAASRATHEFYRPNTTEGLNAATKDHVVRGGLLFRRRACLPPATCPNQSFENHPEPWRQRRRRHG